MCYDACNVIFRTCGMFHCFLYVYKIIDIGRIFHKIESLLHITTYIYVEFLLVEVAIQLKFDSGYFSNENNKYSIKG